VTGGTTARALVSLIDLVPTMIDAAGTAAPSDIDGSSFLRVLRGESDHHREAVFASHTADNEMNRTPMRCVRTADFKYILNLAPQVRYTTHISEAGSRDGKVYWDSWEELARTDARAAEVVARYRQRPAEELYDVVTDPYELTNLAGDPRFAEPLAELRARLKVWRLQQGEDLDFVPGPKDARLGHLDYAK
jgi:uncharacterized sulfatase